MEKGKVEGIKGYEMLSWQARRGEIRKKTDENAVLERAMHDVAVQRASKWTR